MAQMKTIRERAVELHNSGVPKETIGRELGLSVPEVDTKLNQSRRTGVPVRPDGMSVEAFQKEFPRAAGASQAQVAKAVALAAAPRKDTTPDAARISKAEETDWKLVVAAWNRNPDAKAVARQFKLKQSELVAEIGRLRTLGVLLKYKPRGTSLCEIKAAAEAALTPDEKFELLAEIEKRRSTRLTAGRAKSAKVHKLDVAAIKTEALPVLSERKRVEA